MQQLISGPSALAMLFSAMLAAMIYASFSYRRALIRAVGAVVALFCAAFFFATGDWESAILGCLGALAVPIVLGGRKCGPDAG